MPLVDLGPAPVKKKEKGLVDLGPAPTPIMEAIKSTEPTPEDLDIYRRMGVKQYRSPVEGTLYDLARPEVPVTLPTIADPSAPPKGFVPTLPKKEVVEKRRPLEFRAAPEPTAWQKFKGFFVGDRQPLPPDADRMEKIDRAFDIAIGSPLRVFLKFSKGINLNIPDLMWAGVKRVAPESMWDEKVKNMNLDQAMDWASGYDPSGFEKTVGELSEFVGRLRTAGQIGTSLGLLGKTPKDISVLTKAWETAKLFGLAAGFEQVAENLAEKVEPTEAEYGAEGKEAILRDMAIGAILSIAHSGVRGIWTKLKPTEQARALKLLGLKKGATEREIIKASHKIALKTHPDKVKGLEGQYKKMMQAREFLEKGPKKDIVYAKRPPKVPARITGEIRPPEAPITAEARQAAEITKMDAELAEIQKPARIKPTKPTVAPPVAKVTPEAPVITPKVAEAKPEKISQEQFNKLDIADLWTPGKKVWVKTKEGLVKGEVRSSPRGFKGKNAQIKLEDGSWKTVNAYQGSVNVREYIAPPKAAEAVTAKKLTTQQEGMKTEALRTAEKEGIEIAPSGNLVLYHGTRSGAKIRESGNFPIGSYFAADKAIAKRYAEQAQQKGKAEVMRVEVPPHTVFPSGIAEELYFSANESIPVAEAVTEEKAPSTKPSTKPSIKPSTKPSIEPSIKIPDKYQKVLDRSKAGKYHGKITAGYANVGIRLFEEEKLAKHLGLSVDELRRLVPIKITDQDGWNLPKEPTFEELKAALPRIIEHKGEKPAPPAAEAVTEGFKHEFGIESYRAGDWSSTRSPGAGFTTFEDAQKEMNRLKKATGQQYRVTEYDYKGLVRKNVKQARPTETKDEYRARIRKEKPYKIGETIEVETPKGWVEGKIIGYTSGDVKEDFLRIDIQTPQRKYMAAHPKSVRPLKPTKLVDLGPAPEKQILDLSDKTRKAQLKETEDKISKHEIYSNELEAIDTMSREIGPGYYYVEPELRGEVLQITGKPRQKGFKPQLYKSFTFKKDRNATGWDVAAAERGIEDIDIDEFVRRVDEAIRTGKKTGVLNDKALERALASGDPYFEMLAMKREMLREGFTAAEINDNIREQAKQYGLDESDISAELVPVERVEYVEKKPRVSEKMARKGRQIKAGSEQAALTKAKAVARKLKQPVYLFQRKGRYVVSKNKPTYPPKLPYREISPLAEGELKQKITWLSTPARKQKRLAPPEQPSNILMVTEVKNRFADKGLLDKNGKLKSNARRLAKTFTGKTDLNRMTEEELAKLGPMVDALTVDYRGIARIPTSTDIITKELADKIGKFKEIGALEKIRPAWRVFQKMGLYKEISEPALDAEITSIEELFGFRAEAEQMKKLVGKDKPTSKKLFRAIENPGKIKLTSKEAKVVKWGQKYFRDWADRLGLTSEHRRKNYITHIFEREIDQILKEKHPLDPDLIRALEFITPKTVFNPYLQKRLGKTVGLKEDFWAAIEAYENRAIKKFYYEPLIKRIRVYQKFLPPNSARYLRKYIARITKRPLTIDREFNQTLKEVAQDIEKLPGGKQLARYLTKGNASGMLAYNMTGIYYEAWLGLRPASAIKNLSQHGLVLAETGPVAFIKALKTVGTERASLLLNSKVLRSRKSGYLPGIDQTYIKNLESKRRKITMAMFRWADRINVSDAFLAGYHEAKAKGLSDEWAFKRGDEVARKTQWLYSKLAGAEFMQTSPGRVLGVLTTWPENWAELMNDWIRAKPSQVYTDYAKETGKEIPKVNWAKRRKSLWTYLALVSLAWLIHKKTPFKAIYYTGWTSIKSLADIASGKLPGLTIPRMILNLVAGIALQDKRKIKQSWNEMKRFVVIQKELRDIITGKKDWLNLFIYLETKKKKKEADERPKTFERKQDFTRKKRFEREKKMLRK